jgi:type I restriction enzyme, S subunit
MTLSRYPDYKHSGVDWLGEVPSHWDIERLKNVITLRKITVGDTKGDYTLLSLTLQGVVARDMENPKGKFPAEFDTYQVVEKDDLVFCLFDVEETPRAVGISPCTGMVTGAYTVGRVKKGTSPQYLYNFYLSRDQYKAFKMYYTGLRNVIRSETFNAIPFPAPPINEQIGISIFLVKETAKIDTLITEQERLISLLGEKRQAVISHAVTKGLDPKVKMKSSGMERLKEVPEHWDVKPIQRIASINDEVLPESTEADYEIEYVDIGSVNLSLGIESSEIHKFKDAPSRARRIVKNGDVIVSTVRTYLKAIAFVKEPPVNMIVSTGFAVIRSKIGLESNFAKFGLQSINFIDEVISRSTGISYPAINASELAKIKIPLPPVEEQKAICAYLNKQTLEIDSLISESKKIIVLLQERRSALISAAVTGQIDVRNHQNKEDQ